MIQWTYDPTVPVPIVIVQCRQHPITGSWRWRALGVNNRKLCHSGEAFNTVRACEQNIALLWPPETTRHIVVRGLPDAD